MFLFSTALLILLHLGSGVKVPIKPLVVNARKGSHNNAVSFNSWVLLGPFPVSKGELDGNPLEELDGGAAEIVADVALRGRRKNEKFRSEFGRSGVVQWKTGKAKNGVLTVQYDPIEWQGLVNSIGGMELLEYQTIAASSFHIESNGLYQIYCSGLSSFYIDGSGASFASVGPLNGNPYFGQYLIRNAVVLKKGTYLLRTRVRTKHQGQLACKIDTGLFTQPSTIKIKFVPDWIEAEGVLGNEGNVLVKLISQALSKISGVICSYLE